MRCSVVFGVRLRLLVINISSSSPTINTAAYYQRCVITCETVAVHRRPRLQHLPVAALTQAVKPDIGSESRFLPTPPAFDAEADPRICVRGASPSLFPLPYPSLFLPPFPSLLSCPLLSRPLPSNPIPFPSLPSPTLRSRPPAPCFAARGSGGALKLPQRVRAEPGRQTVFGEL